MSDLVFDCIGAKAEPYAAAPTMTFRFRIAETTGEAVHALLLRIQMRIEPAARRYSVVEGERIGDLFGERSRWGDTMKPVQFALESHMVTAFSGSTEIDVPVSLTYDHEVATSKYFSGLDDGEVPLIILFSGSVFLAGETGFSVEPVPWHKECRFRLPVAVWREAMDAHFPGCAWLRLSRETLEALSRFRSRLALPTWEDTFDVLLERAGTELPEAQAI